MKSKLAILTIILLSAIFIISCKRSFRYSDISNRDEKYYSQLAEACDSLISHFPNDKTNVWILRGDDSSLPKILYNLHAWQINVISGVDSKSNYISGVLILSEPSRSGKSIVWEQADYTNTIWRLFLSDGNQQKLLFATNKLSN